ncbi:MULTISPECIES: urea ABC transporter permease subunit UrtB [unclassified Pseudomonas]|uniref:urea ABC transporter permease subunit UrtB n=1 Tax=unclassified Pseudomonas TaxID=196821 RepID=UPI000BCA0FD2|nr:MULTISPECIES: urea ABC transporter permease subunit UrtB [unclassified Pseudomonas]PVZ16377.1 urea transport system permease protein [Pseudomonas sp. URIL14HWK12:I12]PVZ25767.1 urea transport system permease protein [Pseudomonas sp. URIL14HWK12:I10]PVZ36709.1 urea transport system permease protein [Pseudomonas sp. URIL14HWK12:I11]SNZ12773.1 amino acid/amide ABC transporter membrane protein 1, HAAT family (TC 3.A.1.4.-) [Pseudomonas sp. URIL14HWK12:I9]
MPTYFSRLLLAVLLLVPVRLLAAEAEIGAPSDAAAFVSADYAGQAALLEHWAASPSEARAGLVLAIAEGRLAADSQKRPYIETGGQFTPPADPQDAPRKLRLNNRLRGLAETALASQRLLAGTPEQRLEAARQLQNSARPEQLPWLQQQAAQAPEGALRSALNLALANLQLTANDAQVRLQAVRLLGETGEPMAQARLQNLLAGDTETDTAVRTAAQTSLAQIKRQLMIGEWLGQAFSGLSLGSILLLAALGLAITFGLLGVINMAHGEMLMLGAYATYCVQLLCQRYAPGWLEWYPLLALPVAFGVTAAVGMALERTIIRHLYGRPLETLLATWGISLMLIQAVRVLFGAQNVEVANPAWLSGGLQVLPNLVLPWNRLVIIGFASAVVLLTWLLLNKTRLGLNVRAVTQNRNMAACCGVPTGRVDMLAFGLGSGIAGLGGVALSQVGNVGPDLGQGYIIDSFLVVVLGGVGQLAGSVWAAAGLGVANKLLEPQIGAVLGKILILALVILFIQKRPQGLFALKGRVID